MRPQGLSTCWPPHLHQVGESSCPQVAGTKLFYSGITAQGGEAKYLCIPTDPEYIQPCPRI